MNKQRAKREFSPCKGIPHGFWWIQISMHIAYLGIARPSDAQNELVLRTHDTDAIEHRRDMSRAGDGWVM